jgi:hypothetical protein
LLKLDPLQQLGFLFIPLQRWSGYYVFVGISAEVTRAGLICANVPPGEGALLHIQSVEWLDRAKIRALGPDRKSPFSESLIPGAEELYGIYCTALAVVSYFRVKQQLSQWQVPFAHVQAKSTRSVESDAKMEEGELAVQVDSLVPSLSLSGQELLGELSEMVRPNVFLRIHHWWDASKVRVRFAICWRTNLGLSTEPTKTPEGLEVSYDKASKVMRVSAYDIDRCVDAFKLFALRISRVAVLAKAVTQVQKRKFIPKLRLKELSLSQITFDYWGFCSITVRWMMNLGSQWQYRVECDSTNPHPQGNPHALLAKLIEGHLNNNPEPSSLTHWLRFLRVSILLSRCFRKSH